MTVTNYWLDRADQEMFASRLQNHLNSMFCPPYDADAIQVAANRFYQRDSIKQWNGSITIDHARGEIRVSVDP